MKEFNLEEFKKGNFRVLIGNEFQYEDFKNIIREDLDINIDWCYTKYVILRYINKKIIVTKYCTFDIVKMLLVKEVVDFETLTFDSFYKDPKAISPIHAYDILDDKFTELLQDGVISTREFATMLECLMMLGGKK